MSRNRDNEENIDVSEVLRESRQNAEIRECHKDIDKYFDFMFKFINTSRSNRQHSANCAYIANFNTSLVPQRSTILEDSVDAVQAATRSFDEDRFKHELNQNQMIRSADQKLKLLTSDIDKFFDHLTQMPLNDSLLSRRLITMKKPVKPYGRFARIVLFLMDIFLGSGGSIGEMWQNNNITSMQLQLSWVRLKVKTINNAFQEAFKEALDTEDFQQAEDICKSGITLNPELQKRVDEMLYQAIIDNNIIQATHALMAGAAVNKEYRKKLPLIRAIEKADFRMVNLLVERGADIDSYRSRTCCDSLNNLLRCILFPIAWCFGWKNHATTILHIAAQHAETGDINAPESQIARLLYSRASDTTKAQIDGARRTAAGHFPDIARPLAIQNAAGIVPPFNGVVHLHAPMIEQPVAHYAGTHINVGEGYVIESHLQLPAFVDNGEGLRQR